MILRFHLTLCRLDDVYFHYCEGVYDIEYGRKFEASVRLLVCRLHRSPTSHKQCSFLLIQLTHTIIKSQKC